MERRYKNTADRQTAWFAIFFSLIALTISIVAAILVPSDYFIITFFATFIPLAVILIILALYLTSSKVKVKKGLKKYEKVSSSFINKYEGKLIKDIHIDDKVIDQILISPYGVYVITLKTYEGSIYGLDSEKEWRQSLAFQKIKNPLPNPVLENLELIKRLKELTRLKIEMIPVICLASGNRGYLISKYVYSPNQLDNLIAINSPRVYKEEEIDTIYKAIMKIK